MATKRPVFQGEEQQAIHKKQVAQQADRNKVYRVTEEQQKTRKFTFND